MNLFFKFQAIIRNAKTPIATRRFLRFASAGFLFTAVFSLPDVYFSFANPAPPPAPSRAVVDGKTHADFGICLVNLPGSDELTLGECTEFEVSYDTDMPGSDIRRFEGVENAYACSVKCSNNRSCESWTYAENYLNEELNGSCWLKSSREIQSVPMQGLISGKYPSSDLDCFEGMGFYPHPRFALSNCNGNSLRIESPVPEAGVLFALRSPELPYHSCLIGWPHNKTANVVLINRCEEDSFSSVAWHFDEKDRIRIVGTNYCLDAYNTAKIALWECHDGENQKWERFGDGLRNARTSKCMTVGEHWPYYSQGKRLQMRDCEGGWNQRIIFDHRFTENPTWRKNVKFLMYSKRFSENSNTCLIGWEHNPTANVVLIHDCLKEKVTRISWLHDEKDRIRMVGTKYCLDAYNTAKIALWECHDGENQKWNVVGDRVESRKHKNRCFALGAYWPYYSKGRRLTMNRCDRNDKNQLFHANTKAFDSRWDKTGEIRIDSQKVIGGDRCLIAWDHNKTASPVVYNRCSAEEKKRKTWIYERDTKRIKLAGTGLCLDAYDQNKAALWECHGGENQKWNVIMNKVINAKHGRCLELGGHWPYYARGRTTHLAPCVPGDTGQMFVASDWNR